jgi:hypothetical protein
LINGNLPNWTNNFGRTLSCQAHKFPTMQLNNITIEIMKYKFKKLWRCRRLLAIDVDVEDIVNFYPFLCCQQIQKAAVAGYFSLLIYLFKYLLSYLNPEILCLLHWSIHFLWLLNKQVCVCIYVYLHLPTSYHLIFIFPSNVLQKHGNWYLFYFA